jgi:hypothetical protein
LLNFENSCVRIFNNRSEIDITAAEIDVSQ